MKLYLIALLLVALIAVLLVSCLSAGSRAQRELTPRPGHVVGSPMSHDDSVGYGYPVRELPLPE